MKYTEYTLSSWTSPLSQSEEERVENTIRMIRSAVSSYAKLSNCRIEIFAQGSYANNTNVRQNSDVDICIMLTSTFFCNYVDGKTNTDYGYLDGGTEYSDYKSYIIEALNAKFGYSAISIENKCVNIKANSYHVNADVVPAFQYRDYRAINSLDATKYIEGIKYIANDSSMVINYPKEHINNGKQKNIRTNHAYKKLVRIMKHIRNNMVDEGKINPDKITSFLMECLVWNVPDSIITRSNTWSATIQDSIAYLWNSIKEGKNRQWGEVSERLYLFHSARKWSETETMQFLYDMYSYLEFE